MVACVSPDALHRCPWPSVVVRRCPWPSVAVRRCQSVCECAAPTMVSRNAGTYIHTHIYACVFMRSEITAGLNVPVVSSSSTGNLHPTPCIEWMQGKRGDPGCMAKAKSYAPPSVAITCAWHIHIDVGHYTIELCGGVSCMHLCRLQRLASSSRPAAPCSHTRVRGWRGSRSTTDGCWCHLRSSSMSDSPPSQTPSPGFASSSTSPYRRMCDYRIMQPSVCVTSHSSHCDVFISSNTRVDSPASFISSFPSTSFFHADLPIRLHSVSHVDCACQ